MRKLTTLSLCVALIISTSALTFVQGAVADETVVAVNGENITEAQVVAETERRVRMQSAQMPPDIEITDEMRNQIRYGVVDTLVERTLIEQTLEQKDIEVNDEDVTQEIETLALQQNLSMEQVEAQITQAGLTMDEFEDQIRTKLQVDVLIEEKMDQPEVSDEDAREFYDQNPQFFERPEQVRAAHILILTQGKTAQEQVAARNQIETILERAQAGDDFAALARQFSEDPGSKDQGGEYTFSRGQMVPEFEKAAFDELQEGQISDVVQTDFGYHIIKKLEHIEADVTPFEVVRVQIKEHLTQQQVTEFWNEYTEKLHAEADIEYSASEASLRQGVQQRLQQQHMIQQQMQP